MSAPVVVSGDLPAGVVLQGALIGGAVIVAVDRRRIVSADEAAAVARLVERLARP
jgi:hypothetical protein